MEVQEERGVARETIELRDHQRGAVQPAEREGFNEAGACIACPALDLDQFGYVTPGTALKEISHSLPLSLQAKA
ncbi:hypothetical protein ASG60_20795 [Methylobacterium sp. Leaf469]|nr:hypothetical protein ASG60_20795 [Methylobacterium sp. Leaf469]